MEKKLIGQVTVEEKNEIQTLFERRNGTSLQRFSRRTIASCMRNWLKTLEKQVLSSSRGGTAWLRSISGKAPKVVVGR